MGSNATTTMLYDGDCSFCRRAASWFQRHDLQNKVELIPFQCAPPPFDSDQIQQDARRRIQYIDSAGRRFQGGDAVLQALQDIGWHRRLIGIAQHKPLIWVVELGYRVVSRLRQYY